MKSTPNFWTFVLLFSLVGMVACAIGVIVSLVNNATLFVGSLALATLFGILIRLSVDRI